MTQSEPLRGPAVPPARLPSLLSAVSGITGDTTGRDTFERYVWQAKQAVFAWLQCLGTGSSIAVICERVDDLVVVSDASIRFMQLKTRDRGSWSALHVCSKGHGIDALVKSFKLAKKAGILSWSSFELFLEGPAAAQAETTSFFHDPSAATTRIKTKVKSHGLAARDLDEFLSRLTISPNRPSRRTIDAMVIRLMGAMWPTLTMAEIEKAYLVLLGYAERAQSAESLEMQVRHGLHLLMADGEEECWPQEFSEQVLHRDTLKRLTPPFAGESDEMLLSRVREGVTALELKLARAGASPTVVAKALSLRAEADVARRVALAGSASPESLDVIAQKLLEIAIASAGKAPFVAGSAAAQLRAGDFVTHDLLSRPTDLLSTDVGKIFKGDPRLLYGYLCQLSDECRFGWRVA